MPTSIATEATVNSKVCTSAGMNVLQTANIRRKFARPASLPLMNGMSGTA